MRTEKRVVVVGGHHTPAMAVIGALEERERSEGGLKLRFYWFGHKFSMWSDKSLSAEYREVMAKPIPFFDLRAGKFYRTVNPFKLARLPLGFFDAFRFLIKIRPDLILSFGGYLAFPVALGAYLLRIPIFTHEQTTRAGLSNRLVARLASRVYVSFSSSLEQFPKEKVILSGNPLRQEIFSDRGLYRFREGRRTIYITGGKQGSHLINRAVMTVMKELSENFNILHQSGSSTVSNDFKAISASLENMPEELRGNYVLKDYFTTEEIGSVLARADLVVSRAGANTIYELGVLGKVSILIPIAWSSANEQLSNALYLCRGGGSLIIEEANFSGAKLLENVRKVFAHYSDFRERARRNQANFRRDAERMIGGDVFNFLKIR